ncbi:hypothetical protein DPMN_011222 [Dreissena polymorpha]|uniref:Uncharacterized protein n=1 Tax=Dreissena polymorpha TaxID=45954 RepID=A0A9D4S010_DREPO|nr:hypothetical protein DPMN_011222 [Dreissena polymorpha]
MSRNNGVQKNARPTGGHVFQVTGTIFELVQNIIGTNILTKFHDDRKMPRPFGGHVFPPTGTIFELIQNIIKTNHQTKFHDDRTINVASRLLTRKNTPPPGHIFLTKFHEDRKINVASRVLTRKNAPSPGGHAFQPTGSIFKVFQDIIKMNLLTKFHDGRTINVASRVLTRFYYCHIRTNLLTKFHEDRKINVAARVLTRKNAPSPGGHVFQPTGTIF